jgi:hypothetical protein
MNMYWMALSFLKAARDGVIGELKHLLDNGGDIDSASEGNKETLHIRA